MQNHANSSTTGNARTTKMDDMPRREAARWWEDEGIIDGE
jgi:hypothetical protein